MTETTEKPVVTKQAHVVEEVALSKQSGEREVTVSGTVRRQDVTVEEIDRKSGKCQKVLRQDAEISDPFSSGRTQRSSPGLVQRTASLVSALDLKPCRSRKISNRGIVYVHDHK